jgi:RNA polymerase sigma factor (sigma-70 family)
MSLFSGRPDLLARFRAGDREALDTVYRAYVGRVSQIVANGFRIATTGGAVAGLGRRPADLADAVQEIFLKAFSRTARMSFDGLRDFGPYLSSIARHVMVDRARRNGRELLMPDVDLDVVAGKATASNVYPEIVARWEDPVAVAVARRFIEGLPSDLAGIHRIRYIEGLSQREAAMHLGITRQELRTLEGKLREGLRRELQLSRAEEQTIAENRERIGRSPGRR